MDSGLERQCLYKSLRERSATSPSSGSLLKAAVLCPLEHRHQDKL
jgi:hypothetical protein